MKDNKVIQLAEKQKAKKEVRHEVVRQHSRTLIYNAKPGIGVECIIKNDRLDELGHDIMRYCKHTSNFFDKISYCAYDEYRGFAPESMFGTNYGLGKRLAYRNAYENQHSVEMDILHNLEEDLNRKKTAIEFVMENRRQRMQRLKDSMKDTKHVKQATVKEIHS